MTNIYKKLKRVQTLIDKTDTSESIVLQQLVSSLKTFVNNLLEDNIGQMEDLDCGHAWNFDQSKSKKTRPVVKTSSKRLFLVKIGR